jgi:hypothetical protein
MPESLKMRIKSSTDIWRDKYLFSSCKFSSQHASILITPVQLMPLASRLFLKHLDASFSEFKTFNQLQKLHSPLLRIRLRLISSDSSVYSRALYFRI